MKRYTSLVALVVMSAAAMAQQARPARTPRSGPGQRPAAPTHLYPANVPPLMPSAFAPLPLGTVKPAGWLKDQLLVQANGLTGHLDEFWPSLSESAWKGGKGDAWERGPYYLDGLVPLAYLLEDPRLIEKVKGWMEPILASSQENGWFGPRQNNDRWPLAVGLKVLTQYYEATNDERAMKVIQAYFQYLAAQPADWPGGTWRGSRAMENTIIAHWLYNRTRDRSALAVASSIWLPSYDWNGYFIDFPYPDAAALKGHYDQTSHVVNIAMAVKYPAIWYRQSNNPLDAKSFFEGIKSLDRHHGQAAGRFSGDEHLAGRRPTQGTELCAVVEFMYSLENAMSVFGEGWIGDRLEQLAYNANPGACTPDYWAHQYDQQANQVLVSAAKREWSTNGDNSNVFGLEPNFGCCTANMHQGWPKFVAHMWMAAPSRMRANNDGLAAVALGPCVVTAKVGDGTEVTVEEQTSYPFDGPVKFVVKTAKPVGFPLKIRVPAWAAGATLKVGGEKLPDPVPGTFATIQRSWADGDVVELNLPMNTRLEERFNKAVAVLRGPLYYSLKIDEEYSVLKTWTDKFPAKDYQITPKSPWNYALLVNGKDVPASFKVEVKPTGKVPYEQSAAPVVLTAKARLLPGWELKKNSADDPPVGPVTSSEPLTDVQLIPYGSTRLRITEFPLLKE